MALFLRHLYAVRFARIAAREGDRPTRLLPAFMLGWSVICLRVGRMKTSGQLHAARLLIGIFEVCMFPALAKISTVFYTPQE